MKKLSVLLMVMGLVISLFSIGIAGIGNGMNGGCGECAQKGVPSDPFRTFQADTIDLRQEMMNKRFELQRENLKGTPDKGKIASLQGEIRALQSRILDLRGKSGLPTDKGDGECGQITGGCDKKTMGGCGKGMGGCNKGPCGGRK